MVRNLPWTPCQRAKDDNIDIRPMSLTTSEAVDFGMVGMQTDDTLMLGTTAFGEAEEQARERAQFRAKPKSQLDGNKPLEFNGCTLAKDDTTLGLSQKGQGKKIETIDLKAPDRAQRYMEQRARCIHCFNLPTRGIV